MVRANGKGVVLANLGVVPANLDPMDTLSVGADEAPMGVDSGEFPLIFSDRLLRRSNVRGMLPYVVVLAIAFCVGLNASLWLIVLSRLSMPFLVGLFVLQFFTTRINTSLANWMMRSFHLKPVPSEEGNPFRRNCDDVGDHSLLPFFRCVYPARGHRVVPHAQRNGAGTRDSKDAGAAGGIANVTL
ncbi:MAG TPA: hypothetical protein VK578_03565 [Edaphobacter sp.]|nr:hypothetical protein [Edaphobacter sp.]